MGAVCTCACWVWREGAFTPNPAHKHMEPARLESFRFSASYFPCRAIYSRKGVLRPHAVLGRQLQPLAGRLAQQFRTRPSPGCPPTGRPTHVWILSPIPSLFLLHWDLLLLDYRRYSDGLSLLVAPAAPPPPPPARALPLPSTFRKKWRQTPWSGIRTLPLCLE